MTILYASLRIEPGSKSDADALLASIPGIRTHEVHSHRGYWDYTKVFFHTMSIGSIEPSRTNDPLHITINLRLAVEAGADLNEFLAALLARASE